MKFFSSTGEGTIARFFARGTIVRSPTESNHGHPWSTRTYTNYHKITEIQDFAQNTNTFLNGTKQSSRNSAKGENWALSQTQIHKPPPPPPKDLVVRKLGFFAPNCFTRYSIILQRNQKRIGDYNVIYLLLTAKRII